MPLDAPVTSATAPSGRVAMWLAHPPVDDARAPREAGADGGEQQPLAGAQAPVLAEQAERERDRRGRRVAGLADVVGDALGRELELLGDGLDDAAVRLVV